MWSSLVPVFRLFQIEPSVDLSRYMHPLESNRKVLGLMESALRGGRLTAENNSVLFSIAVHHVAGHVFDDSVSEWKRMQVLERLQQCRDQQAFKAVVEKGVNAPILSKIKV